MLLQELVQTWQAVTATSSRLRKTEAIAAVLARLPEAEMLAGVAYLAGELRQRQIGVGWATLRELPPAADRPSLQVGDVDTAFATIGQQSGAGSTARRRELLSGLFGRATADEQRFLRQLLAGELRQGAQQGVMADAVAKAAGVAVAEVRRALLLQGDLRAVAVAALSGGSAALAAFRLTPGHALAPMLAAPGADDVAAALERISPAALEWKLDGVRIQVHRAGDEVRIFTRSLDDITARLPEIVAVAQDLPVRSVVLDGEVIALRPDGRPRPFQVTAGRVGAQTDPGVPLTAMFFDLLHRDGVDYLDRPEADRFAALADLVPPALLIPRTVTDDAAEAQAFFAAAIRRGHEGVVVKDLQAAYDAGRRGSAWLKVKPRHTLDLVVLAAEWGHGRRHGRLSNLHLGARDPEGGGFVMLGKTFKGLTDQLLAWQTEKLQELAVESGDWVVQVRPELVVEIAFDGVQRSSRYPGGLALRFARVKGYRPDKSAAEADTIATVRDIYRMSGGEPDPAEGGAAPDPR